MSFEIGPAEVLGSPQDDYTRRLVAALPVPDPLRQARRRDPITDVPGTPTSAMLSTSSTKE
ncbi:hypothetical protein [Streptomyces sp. NPDC091209]|uniref:hypothetical protein n=1 Tax=Streptomyces sp. NPDC091209 TaxID=3365974 RepID=UPI003808AE5F